MADEVTDEDRQRLAALVYRSTVRNIKATAYCDRILSHNPNGAELMFLVTVKQILLGLDDGREAGETEDRDG